MVPFSPKSVRPICPSLCTATNKIPATQTAPTIGTSQRLNGTYAVMMIDLDIPSRTGGATSTLLHWMQTDLVSANASTMINGVKVFELINPNNVAAAAPYFGPSPPNRAPVSHRYTEILVDTTSLGAAKKNGTGMNALMLAGATRGNFSAETILQKVGAKVVAGNSFNVTSPEALTGGSSSSGNGTTSGGATSGGATNGGSGNNQSNSTVTTGSPSPSQETAANAAVKPSTTASPSGAEQVGKGFFLATVLAIGIASFLI